MVIAVLLNNNNKKRDVRMEMQCTEKDAPLFSCCWKNRRLILLTTQCFIVWFWRNSWCFIVIVDVLFVVSFEVAKKHKDSQYTIYLLCMYRQEWSSGGRGWKATKDSIYSLEATDSAWHGTHIHNIGSNLYHELDTFEYIYSIHMNHINPEQPYSNYK